MVTDNEDGDSVAKIAEMLGLMTLTCYEALSEHALFKPGSDIKNIGIMSLMLLEFARGSGCDLDIGWGCEVVRMCDEAGIDLDKELRKQVDFSKEDLKNMREDYEDKEEGYKDTAEMKDWKPEDDIGNRWGGDRRDWYRWDWKLEVRCYRVDDLLEANKLCAV